MHPSEWITSQWLWAGLALAGIVALLLLLGRGARAVGLAPRAGGQRLRVEEMLALDTRRRLLLVRVDDRRLLLLTGGTTDQNLGWLPPAAKADEA